MNSFRIGYRLSPFLSFSSMFSSVILHYSSWQSPYHSQHSPCHLYHSPIFWISPIFPSPLIGSFAAIPLHRLPTHHHHNRRSPLHTADRESANRTLPDAKHVPRMSSNQKSLLRMVQLGEEVSLLLCVTLHRVGAWSVIQTLDSDMFYRMGKDSLLENVGTHVYPTETLSARTGCLRWRNSVFGGSSSDQNHFALQRLRKSFSWIPREILANFLAYAPFSWIISK